MSAISGIDIALWDLKGMSCMAISFFSLPLEILYAAQIALQIGNKCHTGPHTSGPVAQGCRCGVRG